MKIYLVMILSMFFYGCAYDDPHQNFLKYQSWQIGTTIEKFNDFRMKNSHVNALTSLIDDDVLANGNGLAKYWYVRPRGNNEFGFNDGYCIEMYEYNRLSRKILRSSFEGNRCVWNP